MPRQPRFWFPGAVLYVIQRGNNRAPMFVDDCDRQYFVDDLIAASRKHGVAVHAYARSIEGQIRHSADGHATGNGRCSGMPRQPRFWFPGAVLHVIQRGNNRAPMFVDDCDRQYFVDDLIAASRKHGVAVHAYVVMTNHVHLLASPQAADAMPRTMQMAGRRYVGRFNRLHSRTGTLWEGRYRAALVDADQYFFACMRYIESNPVRAGMVGWPEEYRWSSHRANALGTVDPLVTHHAIYESLGGVAGSRRDAYRRMFEHALPERELRAIRDATRFEWALGSEAYGRMVEALAGRRAARLPMGPRRRDAKE